MTPLQVDVIDDQRALVISSKAIEKIVNAVVTVEGRQFDEVAIHLIDTPAICALHAEYFDDPSTTDCISFPVDDDSAIGYRPMGDVFVCPETAVAYAKEHQGDAYRETTLYIVHGLLHLMGYDDIEPMDERAMREAEARHMKVLEERGLLLQPKTPVVP